MELFVARQPIFDRNGQVYGYELLYRSGSQNYFNGDNCDQATLDLIRTSFTVIGINTLAGDRQVFINCTEQFLLNSEAVMLLPPNQVILEILENISASQEVIQVCRKLKAQGYRFALDDFVWRTELKPLLELVEIIKVDFLASDESSQAALLKAIDPDRVALLAEKVETYEQYQKALNQGYKYFQGYYFSKPKVFSGRDISPFKLTCLRIIQEIYHPLFSFEEMERIIKSDLSLVYKLLRLVNSAAFGLRNRVSSIKQALVLLGVKKFKKWVALIEMRRIGEDKPSELVVTALIRANLCEALAKKAGLADRSPELFLIGLFSLIDVLLERKMTEIVTELALAPEICQVLLGEKNQLSQVLDLVLSYERGDWDYFKAQCAVLKINEAEVVQIYLNTLGLVRQLME